MAIPCFMKVRWSRRRAATLQSRYRTGRRILTRSTKLKKDGLIDNELAMRVQMKFYDYEIQPGTYTLNTSMSSKKMLQILNEKTEEEGDKTS